MNQLELNQTLQSNSKNYNPLTPDEKIEELKRILHLAPSSMNMQPWQFTFVKNKSVKHKLALSSVDNAEKINQADVLIVFSVVDNLDSFQLVIEKELPEGLQELYNNIKNFTSESDLKIWFSKQVYIAFSIALGTAVSLGLHPTPLEDIKPEKYTEILNMVDYKPILTLAINFETENDFFESTDKPKTRRCIEDVIINID